MGHHFRDGEDGERVFFSDKFLVFDRQTLKELDTKSADNPILAQALKIIAGEEKRHPGEVDDHVVLNMASKTAVPGVIAAAFNYADRDSEYAEDIVERLWELHPDYMQAHHSEPGRIEVVTDRSDHQTRVDECMRGWAQEVPDVVTMPSEDVRRLRARLIFEEALETINALGFTPGLSSEHGQADKITMGDCYMVADREPDMVEIADGCADLSVVTVGTLSACGIADKPLLELVDDNNLAKVAKGHVNEHGKFVKPEGHKPPDIAKHLEDQKGW